MCVNVTLRKNEFSNVALGRKSLPTPALELCCKMNKEITNLVSLWSKY